MRWCFAVPVRYRFICFAQIRIQLNCVCGSILFVCSSKQNAYLYSIPFSEPAKEKPSLLAEKKEGKLCLYCVKCSLFILVMHSINDCIHVFVYINVNSQQSMSLYCGQGAEFRRRCSDERVGSGMAQGIPLQLLMCYSFCHTLKKPLKPFPSSSTWFFPRLQGVHMEQK